MHTFEYVIGLLINSWTKKKTKPVSSKSPGRAAPRYPPNKQLQIEFDDRNQELNTVLTNYIKDSN